MLWSSVQWVLKHLSNCYSPLLLRIHPASNVSSHIDTFLINTSGPVCLAAIHNHIIRWGKMLISFLFPNHIIRWSLSHPSIGCQSRSVGVVLILLTNYNLFFKPHGVPELFLLKNVPNRHLTFCLICFSITIAPSTGRDRVNSTRLELKCHTWKTFFFRIRLLIYYLFITYSTHLKEMCSYTYGWSFLFF